MSETRLEHDSLGDLPVPSWALYGIQTERARHNFAISGLKPMPIFVDAMVWIKRAAALTHKETGRLDARLADAIVQAADEVLGGQYRDQFVVDPYQAGAGTSHNMNVNEVLANRANEILGGTRGEYRPVHPNDHVNMAQSTNDTIPTAIRLGALAMLPHLLGAMGKLAGALLERGEEFDGIVKAGRTHLQDATPIRLGQEFTAWGGTVERSRQRIEEAAAWLRDLNIGGSAVGTGLNVEPDYPRLMVEHLREATGLDLRQGADRVQLMQSMGDQAGFSAALRTYAVDLSKIANDIRLLSSGPRTGFAEIQLPAVQPGSSIMPGKVNPVIAEMVNMVCYQVIGNDATVAAAAEAGQIELNVMMPVIAHNLFFSMKILTSASRTFAERCIAGIEADEARCAYWLERSPAIITALAPKIGYAEAAKLAKEAVERGMTIRELVAQQGILSPEELDRALDLRAMTEPGVPGDR
ncbi:MAG: aspartate ammonia-lyase [Gemmatimonadales bacterium]|nr:aspartate ammonia-lyase [Gemmatimonadales bacterium]NIN13533.1 aspartate ammonia-lyase [Gemmatimonadales bacterium]NIN51527.1 aspartate ammonia-lyase [Gemmatimonadales bacterium]NIP08991.1 aspartate ammonia-lyase [Gemmatimonadales bacterium]NIR03769.1 aspartate ammonia-lyase [Gemmatimonadales bacterium]